MKFVGETRPVSRRSSSGNVVESGYWPVVLDSTRSIVRWVPMMLGPGRAQRVADEIAAELNAGKTRRGR